MPSKGLDAAFFPHVIDSIFASASPAALLALRVNRTWRRRAERQLAYHVCVVATHADRPTSEVKYHLKTAERELIGVFKAADFSNPSTVFPSFLTSTAVVDLWIPTFDENVARILQHAPDNVTYRCCERCDMSGQQSSACRLVMLAESTEESESFPDASSSRLDERHGSANDGQHGSATVVLHLWEGSVSHVPRKAHLCNLTSLVFISHRQPVRLSQDPEHRGSERPLAQLITMLMDSTIANFLQRGPATFVNFGFFDLAAGNMIKGIVATLLNSDVNALAPVDMRFLTLEEYRAEVGDAQFEIETNPGPVSAPRIGSRSLALV